MTSLKTSIKTITYLSDTGCLEIQGASLLTSTTCSMNDYTVFSRKSCTFDMRPPGAGDRTPQLKLSASELIWLSKTIDTERNNIKE
ncbi:hypothetical protein EAN55_23940 [Escherichia albertii]|nr:hypothetical protein [Escherichia albertii]